MSLQTFCRHYTCYVTQACNACTVSNPRRARAKVALTHVDDMQEEWPKWQYGYAASWYLDATADR